MSALNATGATERSCDRGTAHRPIDAGEVMLLLGALLLGGGGVVDQVHGATLTAITASAAVGALLWFARSRRTVAIGARRALRRGMRRWLLIAGLAGILVIALVLYGLLQAHGAQAPRLVSWLALAGGSLLVMASLVGTVDLP